MSKPDDGGAAFPRYWLDEQSGMSLRDWFAGQALVGLLGHPTWWGQERDEDGSFPFDSPGSENSEVARTAYWIADAMLAERAKEKA